MSRKSHFVRFPLQNTKSTLGPISWLRRLMPATFALGLLLTFGFAQPASAQNAAQNPQVTTACTSTSLCLDNTYLVTGDYVVGSVGLLGLGSTSATGVPGFATGTISIPDCVQATALGVSCSSLPTVPAGADIVAAFLYWETVESTTLGSPTGQDGFFNGYPISGTALGNKNNPINWSSGGCTGNAQGSKTIKVYRADVRPFLTLDSNGNIQPNGSYQVSLIDSGSSPGATPHTPGATLVIIYRLVSTIASKPLNAIVLYDGAAGMSNASSSLVQPIVGFYQAAASPVAKMTHIVGFGQTKKNETVTLNGNPLPALYPAFPGDTFPGIYQGGAWDSPTWTDGNTTSPGPTISSIVANTTPSYSVTSATNPASPNGECVDYGVIIFSTTVADSNQDGLLQVWKAPPSGPQGYTDAKSGNFVPLPGANPTGKDIFVEVDYLSNLLDSVADTYKHSHLPKQLALDMVGDAFWKRNIHVHFDVGANYQGNTFCKLTPALSGQPSCPAPDPYIIQGGTGGNSISEGALLCQDGVNGVTLCQFPSTPATNVFEPTVTWKGGFIFVRDTAALGNFLPGRGLSYRYVLFGHSLGDSRSVWTTQESTLSNSPPGLVPQLVSIVNRGTTATVTLQSPPGLFLGNLAVPPQCPNNAIHACSDNNLDRVTVVGALGQPALNGTYQFSAPTSSPIVINGITVTTTTFNITTSNVADGTYKFSCGAGDASDLPACAAESQLGVLYAGPTSSSGHSDFRGGGDAAIMLAWPQDDQPPYPNCQADPSKAPAAGQTYCNNLLGTPLQQAGTLLHESGHFLTLTHGGTFNIDPNNPWVPTYGLNCGSNKLTMMNYLFQVRGFPDTLAVVDYSSQVFPALDENNLSESTGIGLDTSGNPAVHFTRWFGPQNALDIQLGRKATRHCDGTAVSQGEPAAVRVDGTTYPSPSPNGPTDWDNDTDPVPDPNPGNPVPWQDVNFNGSTSGSPDSGTLMQGFNDWINLDLRQTGARGGAAGFSGTGGVPIPVNGGTGVYNPIDGGGGAPEPVNGNGGTLQPVPGGTGVPQPVPGGGGVYEPTPGGGGTEQDLETACSSADPATGLTATMSGKSVLLIWTAPGGPCQVRRYDVWRAQGSFPTLGSVLTNLAQFTDITPKGINGTPPNPTFTDNSKLQNNTQYTYFVTETNAQGATSNASRPVVIPVIFSTK